MKAFSGKNKCAQSQVKRNENFIFLIIRPLDIKRKMLFVDRVYEDYSGP